MVAVSDGPIYFPSPFDSARAALDRASARISNGPAWGWPGEAPGRRANSPDVRIRIPHGLDSEATEVLIGCVTHLLEFRAREAGWDGRRGQPLSDEATEVAANLLANLVQESRPTPQLVPLVSGGVQLEWHVADNDLEIEVDVKGGIHVLAVTAVDEVTLDREVSPLFVDSYVPEIRRQLRRMRRILQESGQ